MPYQRARTSLILGCRSQNGKNVLFLVFSCPSVRAFVYILQSFGTKTRGYLESFPEVLKIGDIIEIDVLFSTLSPRIFAARATVLDKWRLAVGFLDSSFSTHFKIKT